MPFLSDKDISRTFENFIKNIKEEKDKFDDKGNKKPRFHWIRGAGNYEAFDGRTYFAYPPCLPNPAAEQGQGGTNETKFTRMVFYYLRFKDNGALVSRIYEEAKGSQSSDYYNDADLKEFVEKNIKEARGKDTNKSPDNQNWPEPTLIAIFMDHSDWKLINIDIQNEKASFSFHFHSVEMRKVIDHSPVRGGSRKNYSFFNSKNVEVDRSLVNQGGGSQFLSVENHHNNTVLPGVRRSSAQSKDFYDYYKFDIFYKVGYGTKNGENLIMIVDPGGRNTGP